MDGQTCHAWLLASFNKRLSQQPALGALIFLRSFVAGKVNFCSHLLASFVHFTVAKSHAILIIHLGIAEVIYHSSWGRRNYFRRNFISSASFETTKFLPRWICSGTTILHVDFAYRSTMCLYNVSRGDELIKRIKRKNAKKHQYPTFPDQYIPIPLECSKNLRCNKIFTLVLRLNPSFGFVTEQETQNTENRNKKRRQSLDSRPE